MGEDTIELHKVYADIPNYKIIEEIAEGGFGKIYKAKQINSDNLVAIKVLKLELVDASKRDQYISRFEREMQICLEINHPNIVKLLDSGITDSNDPFAVFEFIEGVILKELILKSGGIPALETSIIMMQVLEALSYAHNKGIVHRDLKPQNIMVSQFDEQPNIKVLDFGIGTFTSDNKNIENKSLTITKEVIGTPTYSAPEQLRGEPVSTKSDLYAWGLIFVECLTGEPVMRANSIAEVFEQQLNVANVPLPPSLSGLPITDLLRGVLNKNTDFRTNTAEEVAIACSKINFNALVGKIESHNFIPTDPQEDVTSIHSIEFNQTKPAEKKQITVLCAKLNLIYTKDSKLDLEILDTILQDQLNLCKDSVIKYGGYFAGTLANNLSFHFGYPQVSDNDARKAASSALELISQINRRNSLLKEQHGIGLSISIGMNSGVVVSLQNQTPQGQVPNTAFNILNAAEPGSILVSIETKKLLDQYLDFDSNSKRILDDFSQSTTCFQLTGEREASSQAYNSQFNSRKKMVGRQEEFKLVMQHWNKLETSKKGILINGQAGIGKSKLISEIKNEVLKGSNNIIEGKCLPEHQNNALFPIIEIIKKQLGFSLSTNDSTAIKTLEGKFQNSELDLNQTLGVLLSWFYIPNTEKYPTPTLGPDQQKTILFDALSFLFGILNKGDKFLLIIEDIHWADPSSLEFLNTLLPSELNSLILLTHRPEFDYSLNEDAVQKIELSSLADSSASELIKNALEGLNTEQNVIDFIKNKTDGIPLFIEELTSMLLEKKHLYFENNSYKLASNIEEKNIPSTLNSLLNAKLDNIGFAKETAQIASTIGREFNYELLIKSSSKSEAVVQSDLKVLLDSELVYKQRKVNGDSYSFKHALIKDAAYDGMLNSTRQKIHLSIAEILEKEINLNPITAMVLETLGNHLFEGGRVSEGIEQIIKATDITKMRSANLETAALCNKGIHWFSKLSESSTTHVKQIQLRNVLLASLMATEGYGSPNVGEQLHKLQELCVKHSEQEQLFSTMCIKIVHHLCCNDWKSATSSAKFFAEEANKQDKTKWIISSSVMLGQQYFLDGKLNEAQSLLETALDLYDHSDFADLTYQFGINQGILAASVLTSVYAFTGDHDKIKAIEEKALSWMKDLNHVHSSASLLYGLACSHFYKGAKEKTKKYCAELMQVGTEKEPNMLMMVGQTLSFWGNDDLEGLKKSVADQEAMGIIGVRTFWYTIIAALEYKNGKYENAKERILKAISFINVSDGHLYEAQLLHLLGLSELKLGNKTDADVNLNKAKVIASKQGANIIVENIM